MIGLDGARLEQSILAWNHFILLRGLYLRPISMVLEVALGVARHDGFFSRVVSFLLFKVDRCPPVR